MPSNVNSIRRRRGAQKRPRRSTVPTYGSPNLGRFSGPSSLLAISEPSMPLFPTATRRLLRYSDDITLTVASGVMANYIFRLNDLYDPNVSSTGHQPMGFDQLMVFYDHFTVESASIHSLFTNTTSGNPFVSVRLDGNNVTVTDPTVLKESGGYIMTQLNQASPGQSQTLTMELDVAKFHGINKSALTATESLTGSISSSPSDGIFGHVSAWDPAGASNTVRVTVVIEFWAMFTEPRVPSLSRINEIREASLSRRFQKIKDEEKWTNLRVVV